ncbi:MAG: phytanoyl-CoA dioxygenase family protein [Aureliella sp.]
MTLNEPADRWQPSLDRDGCQFIRQVLSPEQISCAQDKFDQTLDSSGPEILSSRGVAYGARNVLELWPEVVDLLGSYSVQQFVGSVVGPRATVVRGLLFDKPPSRSWTLPWHRDRTIAVEDCEPDQLPNGYSSPTRKAGVLHLSAPNSLLDQMLTLRVSLDAMSDENGQLVVLPGSHNIDSISGQDADLTNLDENESEECRGGPQPVYCHTGDILAMRPLLAHSSIKSSDRTSMRRRVVHLEICDPSLLPSPLKWKHSLSIRTDSSHASG